MDKTESGTKGNSAYLLMGLMVLTLIGFYPTYISKIPSFEGITTVHHFHGAMMMVWFGFLVVQPFLIRYKQYSLHRTLGKVSYAVAPLMLYSIFAASKAEYFRDLAQYGNEEALAGLVLDMTSIAAFAVCYGLAIWYKRFPSYHMRFMICTALTIMGPGILRAISIYEVFGPIDFHTYVHITSVIVISIALILILVDLIKGNPWKPYLVVIALILGITFAFVNRLSDGWLAVAEKIVAWTF